MTTKRAKGLTIKGAGLRASIPTVEKHLGLDKPSAERTPLEIALGKLWLLNDNNTLSVFTMFRMLKEYEESGRSPAFRQKFYLEYALHSTTLIYRILKPRGERDARHEEVRDIFFEYWDATHNT